MSASAMTSDELKRIHVKPGRTRLVLSSAYLARSSERTQMDPMRLKPSVC